MAEMSETIERAVREWRDARNQAIESVLRHEPMSVLAEKSSRLTRAEIALMAAAATLDSMGKLQ
jgi:hypothetical protein